MLIFQTENETRVTPMLTCKSDFSWFDACHNDDLETVKEMAKRHVHTHDKREQYIGFTGLMHAAVSDAAIVFAYLLPIEIDDRTTDYNDLLAPSVSNVSQMRTAPGTTALMMVLISNSYRCLQQYIRYVKSVTPMTAEAKPGPQNADGLSAFHFAGIVQSNIGYMYLNSDLQTLLQDISAKAADGMTPLHAILYYKRVQILQYLIDLTEQYIQAKKRIVLESKERYHTQHQLEILIHTLKQQIHEPYNNYSCLELSQRSPPLKNYLEISNEDSSATQILYQKFIKILDSTQ